MYNREILLEKINKQEQQWDNQLKYLQAKVTEFDSEKRRRMEGYVHHLNLKLKIIGINTNLLKNADIQFWHTQGDKITRCWEELVHTVDYVILSYIRIFGDN